MYLYLYLYLYLEHLAKQMRKNLQNVRPPTGYGVLGHIFSASFHSLSYGNIDKIKNSKCRVQVLAADEDQVLSFYHQKELAKYLSCKLHIINSGHALNSNRAKYCNHLISAIVENVEHNEISKM